MKPIILRIRFDDSHLQGLRSLQTGRPRRKAKATTKAMRRHLGHIVEAELIRLSRQHGAQIELI